MRYFAHSTSDASQADWQLLSEHLIDTGRGAAANAEPFGCEALAQTAGRLHDLGKYTQAFAQRLQGTGPRVDHSTWGARIACERFGPMGQLLAYGIAGHHAGLANGQTAGERSALAERIAGPLPALDAVWQREIELPAALSPPRHFKPWGATRAEAQQRTQFQLSLLARMLFSCLVDADYRDTEAFYDRVEGRQRAAVRAQAAPPLTALRAQLDAFLQGFCADTPVNRIRADVLRHVRHGAAQSPGLFSLTVPTGGGKTLASLAFALDHAIHHGLRRVIFVIPFTSIVEQNAAVFRRALGPLGQAAVLEHHSAFVDDAASAKESREKLRLAMENWDAPIVVTTAVQFFESLFAARPSQCRKLHNIAASVVVIDEAQTLPLTLLRPCVATIDELARNYRVSVVLCTATQPVLQAEKFEGGLHGLRELAPDKALLFDQLARVHVRHIGTLDDQALAERMRAQPQLLCIVNNRRHARAVYEAMADLPGARHLSTLMCARHRSQVLDDVRAMLKSEEPCAVVSTSLIEAGVDVDFPTVLRAEAGLDAIAQAAGRCNREGKRAVNDSEVLIFATANEDWAPPAELRQFAQVASETLLLHADDPLAPAAIEHYFSQLYWQRGADQLDRHNLLGLLRASSPDSLPMETLATCFRMIDSAQRPVIVPFDDAARGHLRELRHAEHCGALARQLQPYLVQLPVPAFNALRDAGAIQRVAPEKWGEQFWKLAHEDLYDPHVGLRWDEPTFTRSESLMW